jgi:hypothetical protein
VKFQRAGNRRAAERKGESGRLGLLRLARNPGPEWARDWRSEGQADSTDAELRIDRCLLASRWLMASVARSWGSFGGWRIGVKPGMNDQSPLLAARGGKNKRKRKEEKREKKKQGLGETSESCFCLFSLSLA